MQCPRRSEGGAGSHPAFQRDDDTGPDGRCLFCGSLDAAEFMQRCEDGTVLLGSTDKSYKVYVRPVKGGTPLASIKFYFQHLSPEQQSRFIELHNEKRLVFEMGHGFYVTPFFAQKA